MPVFQNYGTITYFTTATGSTAKNLGTTTTTAPTATQSFPARTCFIRAAKANSATVWIGDATVTSTGTGNVLIDLQPGESIYLDINNLGLLWAASAAAQAVTVATLR